MGKQNALIEHDKKIAAARELIKTSHGYVRRDAVKYLKRLERERAEYLRLWDGGALKNEAQNGKTVGEPHKANVRSE